MTITLDRQLCHLRETPLVRDIRRITGCPDVCSYYVPRERRWCIGVWKNRLQGTVREVFSYARSAEVDRSDIGYLRRVLSPAYRKKKHHQGLAARRRATEASDRREMDLAGDRRARRRPRKIQIVNP